MSAAAPPTQKDLSTQRYSLTPVDKVDVGGVKKADPAVVKLFGEAWERNDGDRGKIIAELGLEEHAGEWAEGLDKEGFIKKFAGHAGEAIGEKCPLAGASYRHVQTNGITLRYVEVGSPTSPTVLMLHGWPESWYSWRHQMAQLSARGFHCVAPDLRGFGGSDAPLPVESYAMYSVLDDILGLLDAIGKQRVALIAHDWGCILGWAFAALRPDRFPVVSMMSVPPSRSLGCWASDKHLVANNPHSKSQDFFYIVYHNECEPHNKYGEAWPFAEGVTSGVAEKEYDSDPADLLRMVYFNSKASSCTALQPWSKPTVTDPQRSAGGWLGRMPLATGFPPWCTQEDFDYYVNEFKRRGFRGGVNYYRNMDANIVATQHLPESTQVQQPCLFLAGEYDVTVMWNPAGMRGLAEDVEMRCADPVGAYFIEDCGHWLMSEASQDVSDALEIFLSEAVVEGGEFAALELQTAASDQMRRRLQEAMGKGPHPQMVGAKARAAAAGTPESQQ